MSNTIVIIPAYNEEQTIGELIERSKKFTDVCVVNDGSIDKTADIVNSYSGVRQIIHKKNTHIPQTILDGMKYAYDNNYDYVITMDAGLSHSPEELIHFLEYPDCDLLIGCRKEKTNLPWYRNILSKFGSFSVNMVMRPIFSNLPYRYYIDITSGYRRYSKKW